MLNSEAIALITFLLGLISFSIGVVTKVWQTSAKLSVVRADLQRSIAQAEYDRKINDKALECLQSEQRMQFEAFLEKFKIFSDRSRSEHEKLESRVNALERFLCKTTEFQ
jgi:hypothetical protein